MEIIIVMGMIYGFTLIAIAIAVSADRSDKRRVEKILKEAMDHECDQTTEPT